MYKIQQKPKVSIIILVLNGEQFIKEAFNSALSQTFQDFDILVVDGLSTDRTVEICQGFAQKDNRIRLIIQTSPGLPSARNLGIDSTGGEYIAFLEADDLWHRDKLLLQVEQMEKNPDIGLVSCYSAVIDENGFLLGWQLGLNMNGMVYKDVIRRNPISSCSVPLIRRKCLAEIGQFSNQVKFLDDGEMWIRFTKKFPIKTIPKTLVGYRRCSSNRSRNYKAVIEDGEQTLNRIFNNDPNLSKDFYNFCLSRNASTVAGICLIDKRYKEARESLIHAIKKSKLAFFRDIRMLGIAFLIIAATILSPRIFENTILKWLLPIVFKTNLGKHFIND